MPATCDLRQDDRLRAQVAQEWFDFEVPRKTWFSLHELVEMMGMQETFWREAIENGVLDAYAHNSRIKLVDTKADFRRAHRIHRTAIIDYKLRTRTTVPADTLQRLLTVLDTLGPVSLGVVAEHIARRRQKLANG